MTNTFTEEWFNAILKNLSGTFTRRVLVPNRPLYHNQFHCNYVSAMAKKITYEEGLLLGVNEDTLRRKCDLARIAGEFHDVDHSGGSCPDSENIKCAVKCVFESYAGRYKYLTDKDVRDIIEAIECTEYPFVKDPVSLIGKALRDADMLYTVLGSVEHVLWSNIALLEELKLAGKVPEETTLAEWGVRNAEFHKSITFFTETGKALYKHCIDNGNVHLATLGLADVESVPVSNVIDLGTGVIYVYREPTQPI